MVNNLCSQYGSHPDIKRVYIVAIHLLVPYAFAMSHPLSPSGQMWPMSHIGKSPSIGVSTEQQDKAYPRKNIQCITNRDGVGVSHSRAYAMRSTCWQIWLRLVKKGMDTQTWAKAPHSITQLYCDTMYRSHPELHLCEGERLTCHHWIPILASQPRKWSSTSSSWLTCGKPHIDFHHEQYMGQPIGCSQGLRFKQNSLGVCWGSDFGFSSCTVPTY